MTKDYVLRVGRVSEVKLFITVINSREEAHEATVSIDMPPAFEYLGTDQRVCWSLSHSLQCFVNMMSLVYNKESTLKGHCPKAEGHGL